VGHCLSSPALVARSSRSRLLHDVPAWRPTGAAFSLGCRRARCRAEINLDFDIVRAGRRDAPSGALWPSPGSLVCMMAGRSADWGGCSEAVAHGFSIEQMVELVVPGSQRGGVARGLGQELVGKRGETALIVRRRGPCFSGTLRDRPWPIPRPPGLAARASSGSLYRPGRTRPATGVRFTLSLYTRAERASSSAGRLCSVLGELRAAALWLVNVVAHLRHLSAIRFHDALLSGSRAARAARSQSAACFKKSSGRFMGAPPFFLGSLGLPEPDASFRW
jgi:hypothetical protein